MANVDHHAHLKMLHGADNRDQHRVQRLAARRSVLPCRKQSHVFLSICNHFAGIAPGSASLLEALCCYPWCLSEDHPLEVCPWCDVRSSVTAMLHMSDMEHRVISSLSAKSCSVSRSLYLSLSRLSCCRSQP